MSQSLPVVMYHPWIYWGSIQSYHPGEWMKMLTIPEVFWLLSVSNYNLLPTAFCVWSYSQFWNHFTVCSSSPYTSTTSLWGYYRRWSQKPYWRPHRQYGFASPHPLGSPFHHRSSSHWLSMTSPGWNHADSICLFSCPSCAWKQFPGLAVDSPSEGSSATNRTVIFWPHPILPEGRNKFYFNLQDLLEQGLSRRTSQW